MTEHKKLCDILCDSPSKREKKVKVPRGLKIYNSILDIDLQNWAILESNQ